MRFSRFYIRLFFVFILTVASALKGISQKETNWWVFGKSVGVNFNVTPPQVSQVGQINHFEGCATYSNPKTGALMFYTDGVSVWDKNHQMMPNGYGLKGNFSSSHSALIIPVPGDTNLFHVLTTPYPINNGARRSIVDMRLNNGLGDLDTNFIPGTNPLVRYKNLLIDPNSTDKAAVTISSNRSSYWALLQNPITWELLLYNVSSTGWSPKKVPVSKPTPSFPIPAYGCMKFSPDGKQLAVAYGPIGEVHLFSFNNQLGVFGKKRTIKYLPQGNKFLPYGVEFSPNSKYLYVSSQGVIQYNTQLDSSNFITASGIMVTPSDTLTHNGQLQLGPDKKLYYARGNLERISVINKPNNYGVSCSFQDVGLTTQLPSEVHIGLPTFMTHQLSRNEILAKDGCLGDTSIITLADTSGIDSLKFSFGDPASGALNNSTNLNSKHYYINSGTYEVKAIVFRGIYSDTIVDSIYVAGLPQVALGPDTVMCWGDTLFPKIPDQRFSTAIWDDSSAFNYRRVEAPGLYKVTLFNKCGMSKDSVRVLQLLNNGLNLGNDTSVCQGSSLFYNVKDTLATYLWDNGSLLPTRSITSSGKYWVEVRNFCGVYSDSLKVDFNSPPKVDLGNDTTICETANRVLIVRVKNGSYSWHDGTSLDQFMVLKTEKIWVEVSNECGKNSDTLNIVVDRKPNFSLIDDFTKCYNDSVYLKATNPPPLFLWHDGSTQDKYLVNKPGAYWLTYSNTCGVKTDSVFVSEYPRHIPTINYAQGIFQSTPEKFYTWYKNDTIIFGAFSRNFRADGAGKYYVVTIDENGCEEASNIIELDKDGPVGYYMVNQPFEVSVYPNPSSGYFHCIVRSSQSETVTITVKDFSGRLLHSISSNTNKRAEIDLLKEKNGVYIVEFQSKSFYANRKILIER
ncbi:MAG: T9SS type A sorting domain-containing protein [Salibacteraceae bacterium]